MNWYARDVLFVVLIDNSWQLCLNVLGYAGALHIDCVYSYLLLQQSIDRTILGLFIVL